MATLWELEKLGDLRRVGPAVLFLSEPIHSPTANDTGFVFSVILWFTLSLIVNDCCLVLGGK